jgi:hypothetical protein
MREILKSEWYHDNFLFNIEDSIEKFSSKEGMRERIVNIQLFKDIIDIRYSVCIWYWGLKDA